MRLVLDTNVWLDWLVFDDPGVAPIRAAVATGTAEILINSECEAELARVLAYPRPRTTLDTAAQAACLEACRKIVRVCTTLPAAGTSLPRCRDPDDQKFLELALACGADLLVTRDKALLSLARGGAGRLPFGITTPDRFSE